MNQVSPQLEINVSNSNKKKIPTRIVRVVDGKIVYLAKKRVLVN